MVKLKLDENLGQQAATLLRQAGYDTALGGLSQSEIQGKLWIVQRGQIREYQEPRQSSDG